MRYVVFAVVVGVVTNVSAAAGLKFEVRIDAKCVGSEPPSGRVLVAIAKGKRKPSFDDAGSPGSIVLGVDARQLSAEAVVTLDRSSDIFPLSSLSELAAGEYTVQAVLATNPAVSVHSAPGNLYCEPVTARLDPQTDTVVKLTLDKAFRERRPAQTKTHKYLKISSKLLSEFHGRPMVYRVGVVLPKDFDKQGDFDKQPDKAYPLLVHIGGFGQRYTSARSIQPDGRFVQILLDGAGPFGDPYQVNSANNGPYGDALLTEVIPQIEKSYRCLGTSQARFTCGMSTGGWVSLALQVFYPDAFNGCWSQCPDGVDFRAFQLIDIYRDNNAYVNQFGFERPAQRTLDGDVIFTTRHECHLERVLGRGGRWELSGQQWASWNAVYGPQGSDGCPLPLWDGISGKLNSEAAKHWQKYDLRLVLKRNWKRLGPKLAGGKVNLWAGDADDYFLNNAAHRLKATLEKLDNPKFDGRVEIQMRQPHMPGGWTTKEMLDAMAKRAGLE